MFSLESLRIPIMAAPMAGGPSTPELVAAVGHAGGTGFLAAGYTPVDALAADIAKVRTLTSAPFGVNLFVPAKDLERDHETAAGLLAYRTQLEREGERYGCAIVDPNPEDRDGWEEKIAYLMANPVPFVSFTFGCPDATTIARLQHVDTYVIVTVSDEDEARMAAERGANALCVQGPEAGGHRGTYDVSKQPDNRCLEDLLRGVRGVVNLPMVAAGGISRPETLSAAFNAGAAAVQVGTAFVRSPESGANQLHKDALGSDVYPGTRVTRSFSGRWARGLVNRFLAEHHEHAPAAYPEVNQMTRPIRAAAAASGDAEGMALWAGTGYRDAAVKPAADIVAYLWGDAPRYRIPLAE